MATVSDCKTVSTPRVRRRALHDYAEDQPRAYRPQRKLVAEMAACESRRTARRRLTGAAPVDVDATISQLAALNVTALRQQWQAWLGEQPPRCQSGRVLRMLLAWRLQEQRFGGLSVAAQRLLRDLTSPTKLTKTAPALPKHGTLLTREWKGVVHRVHVLDRGFAHNGVVYASLSEVARVIAGTRWSGPRFFGLSRAQPPGAKP